MAALKRKATAGRAYSPGWLADRKSRFDKLTHDPNAMAGIMARIADGEHLAAICREFDVSYQSMKEFIDGTGPLREAYDRATAAAQDLRIERILRTIEDIGDVDIADIYNDDGSLKPLSEIPVQARKAISGIKTREIEIGDKVVGQNVEVKLYDKLKAKELLGRREKLFGEGQSGGGKGGVTVVVNRNVGQEQPEGVKITAEGQTLEVN